MKFTAWVLIPFLVSFSVGASELQLRFQDLPNRVMSKNGNVIATQESHAAAKERTGYLRRSFLPSLELRAGAENAKMGSASRQNLGYWSAEARMNLFRGGKDSLEEEILRGRVHSSKIRVQKEYQTELKEARKLYWNLAATEFLILELKEAIQRNDDNIRAAQKRTGAGVTTGADPVHFELEKTLLVQNLKKLEHEDDILRTKLSVLVGHDDHEKLKIDRTFPHPPDAEFQEKTLAVEQTLDVSLLRSNEKIEALRARQASRWYLPKLDVYARYGLPALSDDYTLATRKEQETVAGVSLSLDLGQAFQTRSTQLAQNLESQSLSSRAGHMGKVVEAESHELQHDLRLLHELIHDADKDAQRAQQFMRLTMAEYSRGVKNGPDLIEAFRRYFDFRKRKIELDLEYQLAKAEFEELSASIGDSQ